MHDLVTLGEVLLRLSAPTSARIETARTLDVQIGGAEANVAAGCARLGMRVAWISALPASAWGERVRRELTGHGVDCAHVRMVEGARIGVYFLEYGAPPRPIRVLYDRRDSAFARLTPAEVDWEPAAAEAAAISFDVNYRSALWSPADARAYAETVLPRARFVFAGLEEARMVFGLEGSPEHMVEALSRQAPKATVSLLMGEEGSLTFDGGRIVRPRRRPRVEVIDPIGAGDAYVAGFLWAAQRGCDLEETVDTATAVAALKCSIWGDVAIITPRDVEDVLAGGPGVRR